jgi:hypothetical protein
MSAVALLDGAPGAAGAAAALPAAVAPPLDLREMLEYEPPGLPSQPATVALSGLPFVGNPHLVGFVTAAALATVPPVPITYDVGRRTWLLLLDYNYSYEGHTLTAKAGYAFDLSSIPRPVWWLIAPNELSIVAPLFHDLLYEHQGTLPAECVSPYRTYTRRETDDLFLHLMREEGVAWWRRNAAYSAVRSAGGIYWAT